MRWDVGKSLTLKDVKFRGFLFLNELEIFAVNKAGTFLRIYSSNVKV